MIHLDQPEITDDDIFAVAWEMQYGEISTRSKTVNEFEKAIAKYLKVPDAVAVNSGTSALFLSLLACGVGKNDEVILPVLTFIATANAVSYTGARVRFVDVEFDTWNISTGKPYWRYGTKTKCILPVDLYGNPCDMFYFAQDTTYDEDGKPQHVYHVEDKAESLGSNYHHEIYDGNLKCYSFNGNKTLTTGGGGLIVGDNLSKIRQLANVGRDKNGEFVEIGYNYRMNGISAALGLSQLKRLDETIEKKRKINEIYRNELDNILNFQTETVNSKSSFWLTAVTFPAGTDIENLQNKLWQAKIPTRRIFQPLNQLAAYLNDDKFEVADRIYETGLCLPSSVKNSEIQTFEVCKQIKEILK